MYIKKPLFVALLIICLIFGVSCISASEANDTTLTIENQEIDEEVADISSESNNVDEVLSVKNDENDLLTANSKHSLI